MSRPVNPCNMTQDIRSCALSYPEYTGKPPLFEGGGMREPFYV